MLQPTATQAGRAIDPRHRVVSADSPLSALAQRLDYIARSPGRPFVNIIENVPRWPSVAGAPRSSWEHVHNYAPAQGYDELLRRISARESVRHGLDIPPDHLLVTNGALHALSIIFRRHSHPGSLALCQAPVLAAVPQMLRSFGFRPSFFRASGDRVDIPQPRGRRSEKVGLIYVNSPLNPCGDILSAAALSALLALAHQHEAALVVDSVYDSFVFGDLSLATPLSLERDWRRVYVVNSMSKNYGCPGLRIGWMISSRSNADALTTLLERENIAVCGVAQDLACARIADGNAELVDVVRTGRRLLLARLPQIEGVHFDAPAGGTQIFARLPVTDVEQFCDFALVEQGISMVSSSNFEGITGPWVRLPLGAPVDVLDSALRLLAEALTAYNGLPHR